QREVVVLELYLNARYPRIEDLERLGQELLAGLVTLEDDYLRHLCHRLTDSTRGPPSGRCTARGSSTTPARSPWRRPRSSRWPESWRACRRSSGRSRGPALARA